MQELAQELAKIELHDWQQAIVSDVIDSFQNWHPRVEPVIWILFMDRKLANDSLQTRFVWEY
jgi:hypothetical protein